MNQNLVFHLISKEFLALKHVDVSASRPSPRTACPGLLPVAVSLVEWLLWEDTARYQSIVFASIPHFFPWQQIGRVTSWGSRVLRDLTQLQHCWRGKGVELHRKSIKSFSLHCSPACLVRNQMHKTRWTPASWQHEGGTAVHNRLMLAVWGQRFPLPISPTLPAAKLVRLAQRSLSISAPAQGTHWEKEEGAVNQAFRLLKKIYLTENLLNATHSRSSCRIDFEQ